MDYSGRIQQMSGQRTVSLPDFRRKDENKVFDAALKRTPRHTSNNPPEARGKREIKRSISTYHGNKSKGKTARAAKKSSLIQERSSKPPGLSFARIKQSIGVKGLMKKLSPGKKAAYGTLVQNIRGIDVDYEEKLNQGVGAMSLVCPASVTSDKFPDGVKAVCILLRDTAEEINFEPAEKIKTMIQLEKVIGHHLPIIFQIDIHSSTGRPRIIMERLEEIPKMEFKNRLKLSKRFIKVFNKLQKAGIIHGDLKGVNIMCRENSPTVPVFIDLMDVHTINRYKEISTSIELIKMLSDFDQATGAFNPPNIFERLTDLKKQASKLDESVNEVIDKKEKRESVSYDFAKVKSDFESLKNELISLVLEKERCNAACAVYELLYGVESVPGKSVKGFIQKELDLSSIRSKIVSDTDVPGDVKEFLKSGFNL